MRLRLDGAGSRNDARSGAFDDAADFERNDVVEAVQADPEAFGDAKVWNDYGETDDFRPYDERLRAGDGRRRCRLHHPLSGRAAHEGSYCGRARWPAYQRFYVNALNHCG